MSTTGTASYGSTKRLVIPSVIDVNNFGTGIAGAQMTALLTFSSGVSCSYAATIPVAATTAGQLDFVSCSPSGAPGGTVATTSAQISGTTNPAFLAASTTATATLGISIDDGVACTVDKCVNGAVDNSGIMPAGTSCDDGNPCNGIEVCAGGLSTACNAGVPPPSDDGDVCTTFACSPSTGVTYTRAPNCPAVSGLGTAIDLTLPRRYDITSTSTSWLQGLTAAATLDPKRAGVLRGRIVNQNGGAGLSGVTVKILGSAAQVLTDANGFYDFAVNGGESYTVQAALANYVPVQRTATARWHDFTVIPDAALTPEQVTGTTINYNSASWQSALGDLVTGAGSDGNRRTRIVIPPNTTFSNWNPLTSTVVYKVTETTVGPLGPIAMPGELPLQSAYTFAADLSVTGTPLVNGVKQSLLFANTNAINTAFNGTVVAYVENFTNRTAGGLPNYASKPSGGVNVPSGSFDMVTGRWQNEDSGRLLRYIGNTGTPATAKFSLDGTATELTDYTSLGLSVPERQYFATLGYAVNTDIWRVTLRHFTAFDFNWGGGLPNGIPSPAGGPFTDDPTDCNAEPDANTDKREGSIVECTNQVLGEDIPIVGTPISLHYRSETQRGYKPTITIPLSDERTLSPAPKRVEVDITAAGQHAVLNFPGAPAANQKTQWTWDRTDAYGRLVQGTIKAHVKVSYIYGGEVSTYTSSFTPTFGGYSNQAQFGQNRNEREFVMQKSYDVPIGGLDAKPLGLGGWTVSMNHVYEPESGTVWFGYGGKRSVTRWPDTVKNVSTLGSNAIQFYDIVSAPDGKIYLTYGNPSMQLYVWNGSGAPTVLSAPSGGGVSVVSGTTTVGSVALSRPRLAIGPDNRLYIADGGRVLAMDRTTNVLTVVAGSVVAGTSATNSFAGALAPDDAVPLSTQMAELSAIQVAKDGAIFVAETTGTAAKIRRIAPNGKLQTALGGGGTALTAVLDTDTAKKGLDVSMPRIDAFTLDEVGAIVFSAGDFRVWRISGNGSLVRILGLQGLSGLTGDGGPPTSAKTELVTKLSTRGEQIFVSTSGRVRRIAAGQIHTVLGTPTNTAFVDGLPGYQVGVTTAAYAVPHPDGFMYAVSTPYPAAAPALIRFGRVDDAGAPTLRYVPDGDVVYEFNATNGQHLRTLSRLHGTALYTFTYVTAGANLGKLLTITDNTNGTPKTIDFDYSGSPALKIKAFFDKVNQTTTLNLDVNGYLASIVNPKGETFNFTYSPATSGLLATLIDPRQGTSSTHNFTFDPNGLLLVDRDPLGLPGLRLSRSTTYGGTSVKVMSAEGRNTLHELVQGGSTFTHNVTDPAGLLRTFSRSLDRSTSLSLPAASGEVRSVATKTSVDPRWGVADEFDTEVVTTNGLSTNWAKRTTTKLLTTTTPANPFAFTDQTDTVTRTANSANALGSMEIKTTRGATNSTVVTKNLSTLRQTTAGFDTFDRVNSITVNNLIPPAVSPAVTTIAYDTNVNRIKTITQTAGATVRTVNVNYNGTTGRIDSVATPFGTVNYSNYDLAGRPQTVTLPPARTLNLTYDANGNVLTAVPLAQTHNFTPNGVDLLANYTPPAGTWGLSGTTSYTYDKDRMLRMSFEPQGQAMSVDRDGAGRLQTVQMPTIDGNDVRTYAYDSVGRLSSAASVINGVANVTSIYQYKGDRPTQIETDIYSGGTLWSNRQTKWTYDNFGRITHREFDVGTAPFDYTYDAEGNLATITATGLNYTYNIQRTASTGPSAGSLVSATNFGGLGNDLKDSYEYDAFGGLTKYTFSMGATLKYQVIYSRDPATGRVLTKTENIPDQGLSNCVHTYTYDPTGRNYLTNVATTGCSTLFAGAIARDDAGNMTGLHTYDLAQNRMKGDVPSAYEYDYDADGDVSGIRAAGSSTTQYGFSYDVPGNLRRSSPFAWAGSGYFSYSIDANNRRVARQTNGIALPKAGWLYEGNRVIAELETGGYVQNAYAYGTKSNVPDLVLRFYSTPTLHFELYRIVSDQLGSPVLVIKVGGNAPETGTPVLESFAWDEFGSAKGGAIPTYQSFGFAGGLWDSGTYMYRFGARDYSPRGVWWSKDPARFGGGINHYLYANGDPVNFADVSGNISVGTQGVGVGRLGGAAFAGVATAAFLATETPLPAAGPWGWGAIAAGGIAAGVAAYVIAGPLVCASVSSSSDSKSKPDVESGFRTDEWRRNGDGGKPPKTPLECAEQRDIDELFCRSLYDPGDERDLCYRAADDKYQKCLLGY